MVVIVNTSDLRSSSAAADHTRGRVGDDGGGGLAVLDGERDADLGCAGGMKDEVALMEELAGEVAAALEGQVRGLLREQHLEPLRAAHAVRVLADATVAL